MVHSGFRLYFRLVWRTFFHGKDSPGRLTPRRLGVMSVFIPVLFLLQVRHWLGFLLDEIFFRGYRTIEVKEPVFLLGIPRSGTTFLHRLLAKDTETFTTLNLWEMILAPSITERKVMLAAGAVDRLLGGFGRKFLKTLDERVFRSVRKIHRVSMFEPEEDDLLLFPIFGSIFLLFAFPFREELGHLVRFDLDTPPAERDRSMRFYRACVQRHLYVHGAHKRFLSKNPAFSPKIDSIRTHFPDAKVVCNVRTPYSAIPSLLSFLSFSWQRFDNDPRGDEFRDFVLDLAGHWYRHPMNRLPEWPEHSRAFVTYDELTGELHDTVTGLYERFGLEMPAEFEAFLAVEDAKSKAYESKHSYALEDYGLSHEGISLDFGDVFERYGFEIEAGMPSPQAQPAQLFAVGK
jgi:omega-hydroxy-beta-dihydromenaquinone-9 sulfotransferase